MPKERFHILLAEQILNAGTFPLMDARARFSFCLGAISPDVFFYDLPLFGLSSFGNRLHRLLDRSGEELVRKTFEKHRSLSTATAAWLLGFASHFLADRIWHPVIDEMTASRYAPCLKAGLAGLNCHRWIESELEACWVPLLGPSHRYLPLLGEFLAKREWTWACIDFYRRMLIEMGLPGVPGRWRIKKCLTAQVLLLMLFSSDTLGGARDRLLKNPACRYLAALTVPARPSLPDLDPGQFSDGGLLSGKFMADSIRFFAGRLCLLAKRS